MSEPIYQQIADDLRAQIESGKLRPGQQLETEGELIKLYGASRNTVRDAIKRLTGLGLVVPRPGQGTFVVEKPVPFVTTLTADPSTGDSLVYQYQVSQHGRSPSSSEVVVEIQKANAGVAAELGVPKDTQVVSRHQKRYIDETPWSMQTSFYPMGLALKADELLSAGNIEQGAVKYLADTLGLRQVAYRDWITVRAPDANETRFFNLPQDGRVAVFEIFRTAFDQTGTPMRVTITVFPTDRNQFIAVTGDVPTTPKTTAAPENHPSSLPGDGT
jgi:GntR family transcriptional regulator